MGLSIYDSIFSHIMNKIYTSVLHKVSYYEKKTIKVIFLDIFFFFSAITEVLSHIKT